MQFFYEVRFVYRYYIFVHLFYNSLFFILKKTDNRTIKLFTFTDSKFYSMFKLVVKSIQKLLQKSEKFKSFSRDLSELKQQRNGKSKPQENELNRRMQMHHLPKQTKNYT